MSSKNTTDFYWHLCLLGCGFSVCVAQVSVRNSSAAAAAAPAAAAHDQKQGEALKGETVYRKHYTVSLMVSADFIVLAAEKECKQPLNEPPRKWNFSRY